MTEAVKIELPDDQEFFKLNEVCKLANVQPYMLRFWGTEFEQLETTTTETGQRLYTRAQMTLILEIRRLLFDEGLTIASARRAVDGLVESGEIELETEPIAKPPSRRKPAPKKTQPKTKPPQPKQKTEPVAAKQTKPEVDKAPPADVQPLLATLRGVRKELAEIVAELKSSS